MPVYLVGLSAVIIGDNENIVFFDNFYHFHHRGFVGILFQEIIYHFLQVDY